MHEWDAVTGKKNLTQAKLLYVSKTEKNLQILDYDYAEYNSRHTVVERSEYIF